MWYGVLTSLGSYRERYSFGIRSCRSLSRAVVRCTREFTAAVNSSILFFICSTTFSNSLILFSEVVALLLNQKATPPITTASVVAWIISLLSMSDIAYEVSAKLLS